MRELNLYTVCIYVYIYIYTLTITAHFRLLQSLAGHQEKEHTIGLKPFLDDTMILSSKSF